MGKQADRIREIAAEMTDLVNEARNILRDKNSKLLYQHLNMYVFKQIEEHIQKSNMCNKDMEDVAIAVEIVEEDEETEEFTKTEEDYDADDFRDLKHDKEMFEHAQSQVVDDVES